MTPGSSRTAVASVVVVALVVASVTLCSGVAVAHGAGGDGGDERGHGTAHEASGTDHGGADTDHDGPDGPDAHGHGEICPMENAELRAAQTVAGVQMQASRVCRPDRPSVVAAAVAGTNNVPKDVLLDTGLARDAIEKSHDRDGDGDPDVVNVTLEVMGVNEYGSDTDAIAPGVTPSFWVFAPKTRGMVREGSSAERLVRMPSPPIRVEQGDTVRVTVENTHYFPHTIHFHGVDHSFTHDGEGNDGVPGVSERPIMPGESRTYEFTPRTAGTMFYHCHVVPNVHVTMGLNGMFVVEENRSANRVQTINVGAGKVRHPSKGTLENYTGAYDLQYQGVDAELHRLPDEYEDPRRLAAAMNREYDATERDPDYFLLNGKSYPYTIRESLIVVEPNERYRLRVSNGGSETVSLHTHGHKFAIEAYDGVEVPDGQEVRRDVVTVSAAQRVDLALNTTNDGLHSYGPGVWFTHDHREQAVTTDGIAPGGTASMIVYEQYLEDGVPQTGGNLSRLFDPAYYDGEVAYWAHLDENGQLTAPANASTAGASAHAATPTAQSHRHAMTASGDGGSGLGGPVVASGLVVAGVLVGFGLRRYPGKLVVVLVVGLAILSLFAVAAGGTVGGDATHPTAANVSSHGDHHEVEAVETSGGMMDVQLVANGTVVNGSPTEPPGECTSVREERAITVHAGNAFAEPGQVFSYQRTNRTLPACTRVEVTVVNHDSVRHQWMVHGLPTDAYPMGMFNVEVQGDSRVTATFVTPTSGRYAFHCSLPQHEQKGMHGALVIVGTDDTNDTDAAAAAQVGTQDGATGARERQGASPTAGSGPGFGAVTALTGLGVGGRLLRV